MMHGPLDRGVELYYVDSKPRALRKAPELVVHGFDFDSVEWDESGLSGSLTSKVFDTVYASFLVIDDDGINVLAENDRYGGFIFALGRFAEVDNPTPNT